MLHLMLMRHGKSDWDEGGTRDHERPLAERGVKAAERMGVVLRELDLIPDLVVSSTAVRARSTAELARISGAWSSRLVLDEALYGASVAETLERAAHHGGGHGRLMLVGHQPTWSMTVQHLTGVAADMRTATIADIAVTAETWADVPSSTGTLVSVLHARDHMGGE
jgi:phosphohistidine phosphatase